MTAITPTPSFIDETIARLEGRIMPTMILLDVTNVCNMKCIHCPQPLFQNSPEFVSKHMEAEVFDNVIRDLQKNSDPCLLRFVGDGEPMLHPKISEMLIRARRETNCIINLTTNGSRLNREVGVGLLEAGIHMIDISLDALYRNTYDRVRVSGNYMKVMSNIFRIVEKRDSLKSPTRILVSFVKQNENEAEVQEFVNFWKPIVDHVSVRSLHSSNHLVKSSESKERNLASIVERYPCPHPWKRLMVDYRGRIKFCPTDWLGQSTLGSLKELNLQDAWRQLDELRCQHRNGCLPDSVICKQCTDWASAKWDWGYERIVDTLIFNAATLAPGLPLLST